jgi:LmeA-like phospholipid-binding
MELFTILLSGLLAALTPVNLIADKVAANAIRARFNKVEQLKVRIDNAPNYQLIQGKVERVRIAGRGVWLTPDIRIDALELETDPLNVDLQRLRSGTQTNPRSSLRQPIQAGVRLVLTESDLNKALASPTVAARLKIIGSRVLGGSPERYEFINPKIELLASNRLRFQVEVREKDAQPLALNVESGLSIVSGRSLQLVEPVVSINGKPLSPPLVSAITGGVSNGVNLRRFEERGITARFLQFKVDKGKLAVAAFVRVDATKQISLLEPGAN